jgi:lactoylglutathione lyase
METMSVGINHIHLKAPDPGRSAEWFCRAFGFRVLTDETRPVGDRFIRCVTGNGALRVNFSGARDGEVLGAAPNGVHYGLEHFGIDSDDIEADVRRLVAMGAALEEGPKSGRGGQRIAFLRAPDGVRIELIQPPKPGA